METVTWKLILPHVKEIANGNLLGTALAFAIGVMQMGGLNTKT